MTCVKAPRRGRRSTLLMLPVGVALRPARALAFALALFQLGACSGGGDGGKPVTTPVDTTPPTVVSTAPASAATGVAIASAITAVFSEAMNPATINGASFMLYDAANRPVVGNIGYASMTATFTPGAPLAHATTYKVILTAAVTDVAGNGMASDHTWSFTTAAAPDTMPPIVTGTTPNTGATAVPVTSAIGATFSEAMNTATLNASSFTLKDAGNNPVSGTVAYAGTTATFTPAASLAYATTYTATITTGATDLAGNALAAPHSWSFTTAPSFVLTVNKIGGGAGAVTSTPAGIECGGRCSHAYPSGTSVTLNANADAGYVFEGFGGVCAGVKQSCAVTLGADETVTAIFDPVAPSASGNQVGFDGADDVLVHQVGSSPPASSLDLTAFTIEAWIYPLAERSMLVVADSGYYLMVRPSPLRIELAVMTSTGFPAFVSFAGNANPLQLNQWNHVVGIADSFARTLRVAVNGELSVAQTIGGSVQVSQTQTFSVGNSHPSWLGDYPFAGRIDEVRLSSVIRYSSDFAPASLLDADGGTAGLWHLDEAAGATTFADSSGNGNTLTGLAGAAAFAGTRGAQNAASSLFYSRARLDLQDVAFTGPLAIADFNEDGINDLVTAGVGSIAPDKITLLPGTGAGAFGTPTQFLVAERGAHPSIAMGDLDKDGNIDLAVANATTVSVLLGDGSGGFVAQLPLTAGTSPRAIAVGDLDGDGNPDLAVANAGADDVSILLGDGTGAFGAATSFAVGSSPRGIAVGDLDGDGKLDLAVANGGGSTVSLLLGNGAGSFAAAIDFTVGTGPSSIAIGDFNGDGKLDVATANGSANVSVLLGTGTGSFAAAVNHEVPFGGASYLTAADVDGDGKLDLACASGGGTAALAVLRGDGAGAFGAAIPYSTHGNPTALAIGDLDGDGKPDLATSLAYLEIDILFAR